MSVVFGGSGVVSLQASHSVHLGMAQELACVKMQGMRTTVIINFSLGGFGSESDIP